MATTEQTKVTCSVGSFPGGKRQDYALKEGSTVADFLKAAGIDAAERKDVRVGGVKLEDLTTVPKPGDQILVFGNVRGN